MNFGVESRKSNRQEAKIGRLSEPPLSHSQNRKRCSQSPNQKILIQVQSRPDHLKSEVPYTPHHYFINTRKRTKQ